MSIVLCIGKGHDERPGCMWTENLSTPSLTAPMSAYHTTYSTMSLVTPSVTRHHDLECRAIRAAMPVPPSWILPTLDCAIQHYATRSIVPCTASSFSCHLECGSYANHQTSHYQHHPSSSSSSTPPPPSLFIACHDASNASSLARMLTEVAGCTKPPNHSSWISHPSLMDRGGWETGMGEINQNKNNAIQFPYGP
ncbi:unnamed protein product [Periconia digitata]|uniref:Uncharacterized protein n=1 Tax=Periconia digitata TaxID=1303443 RepID=A0A9W4U1K0_9PLEO|nr:unnamed protein product [Periconia digitata]